jgi:hypothetical protein
VTNPSEAIPPGADVVLKHIGHRRAGPEVDVADDAGTDAGRTVQPARRHRGDTVGELGLSHDPERRRPVGAVHRLRLHVDSGLDRVAAVPDVGEVLLEQVAPSGPVPQVVMGVDDRQLGTQGLLAPRGEPVRSDRQVVGTAHGVASPAVEPEKFRGAGPV